MKIAKLLSLAIIVLCLSCSKQEPSQQAFTIDKIQTTTLDNTLSLSYYKAFDNGEVYAFYGASREVNLAIEVDRLDLATHQFNPLYRSQPEDVLITDDVFAAGLDYVFTATLNELLVYKLSSGIPGDVKRIPYDGIYFSGSASSYGDHAILSMNRQNSLLFTYDKLTDEVDTALLLTAFGNVLPEIRASKVLEHEGQIKYAFVVQYIADNPAVGFSSFFLINAENDSIEREISLGPRSRLEPQEGLWVDNKVWFWFGEELLSVDLTSFDFGFKQLPSPIRNGKALGPLVAENGNIILHAGGLTSIDPISGQINWSNSASSWYVPTHNMRYPDYFLAWEGDLEDDRRISLRVYSHATGQPIGQPLLTKVQANDYSLSAFLLEDKLFIHDGYKKLSTYRLRMQP